MAQMTPVLILSSLHFWVWTHKCHIDPKNIQLFARRIDQWRIFPQWVLKSRRPCKRQLSSANKLFNPWHRNVHFTAINQRQWRELRGAQWFFLLNCYRTSGMPLWSQHVTTNIHISFGTCFSNQVIMHLLPLRPTSVGVSLGFWTTYRL